MEKKGRFSPSTAWRWDEAPPRATQGCGPPGPGSCIRSDGRGRPQARAQQRPLRERKPRGAAGQRPPCSGQRRPSCRAPGDATRHRPLLRAFFSTSTMPEVSPTVTVHVVLIWDCSNPAGLKISTCIMLEKRASLCNRERKEVAG